MRDQAGNPICPVCRYPVDDCDYTYGGVCSEACQRAYIEMAKHRLKGGKDEDRDPPEAGRCVDTG